MTDYADLARRLWQLVQQQDGRLEQGARALVGELVGTLKRGGYQLTPEIEAELSRYLDAAESDLRSGIEAATRLGSPKEMRDELVAQLARRAFDERWPDGMTLSQRVWGFRQGFRRGFADVLSQGARTGRSVSALVHDLQRRIEAQYGATFQIAHGELEDWSTLLADAARAAIHNPEGRAAWDATVREVRAHLGKLAETGTRHAAQTAFKKVLSAVRAGNEALIDEAVAWWMYDKQLYLLKRIARTELATAQHRAVIASAIDDPDVIGFQWRLSSTHPEPDICDYYASIDMGLGKGVWTKEAVPRHKAHPHCMCLIIPRVTPVRQPGSKNYGEFIQNVTPERRAQLLPKWAREALAAGTPLQDLIRPDGLGLMTRRVAESANLTQGTKTAYEAAKAGGPHSEWYKKQLSLSEQELRRAIRSFEKQIEKHRQWISDPLTKTPNFYQLDTRRQRSLLEHHWPADIRRHENLIEILRGVLVEKGYEVL